MAPEPANSAAQMALASISAAILAWTGITYLSLLWSFFGVMAATVFITPQLSEGPAFSAKVFVTVFLATLVGAGLAEFAHAMMVSSGIVGDKLATGAHVGIALITGAGAKPLLVAGVNRFVGVMGGTASSKEG